MPNHERRWSGCGFVIFIPDSFHRFRDSETFLRQIHRFYSSFEFSLLRIAPLLWRCPCFPDLFAAVVAAIRNINSRRFVPTKPHFSDLSRSVCVQAVLPELAGRRNTRSTSLKAATFMATDCPIHTEAPRCPTVVAPSRMNTAFSSWPVGTAVQWKRSQSDLRSC